MSPVVCNFTVSHFVPAKNRTDVYNALGNAERFENKTFNDPCSRTRLCHVLLLRDLKSVIFSVTIIARTPAKSGIDLGGVKANGSDLILELIWQKGSGEEEQGIIDLKID